MNRITWTWLLASIFVFSVVTSCDSTESPGGGDADGGGDTDSDTDSDTPEPGWAGFAGGAFDMGAPTSLPDATAEPVHQVTVPAFKIMETEVTVADYNECVDDGACENTSALQGISCNQWVDGRDDYPINCITWLAASSYCTWINARLPTEAEWEFAARSGGQSNSLPWGEADATCDLAVINEGAAGEVTDEGCGTGLSAAVCSLPDGNTVEGLCDMAGNISEWVNDFYHDTYEGAPTDGSSWDDPPGEDRVLRGGDFTSDPLSVFTFKRLHLPVDSWEFWSGVRCAK